MNWRSFLSGALGGLLIVATLSFPQIRAQAPWVAYPTNVVFMIVSGSCPVSTQEVASLDGVMPYGTLSAHGDVGTMGGSDTVTPAGTNGTVSFTPAGTVAAPAFTGSSGTVPAQTFTGSSATTSAVSGGTPSGTNAATTTSGNCAASNLAIGTGATTACKATAPNLTVPAEVFTG